MTRSRYAIQPRIRQQHKSQHNRTIDRGVGNSICTYASTSIYNQHFLCTLTRTNRSNCLHLFTCWVLPTWKGGAKKRTKDRQQMQGQQHGSHWSRLATSGECQVPWLTAWQKLWIRCTVPSRTAYLPSPLPEKAKVTCFFARPVLTDKDFWMRNNAHALHCLHCHTIFINLHLTVLSITITSGDAKSEHAIVGGAVTPADALRAISENIDCRNVSVAKWLHRLG